MRRIADTGLLAAFFDRLDPHHDWAVEQFARFSPFHICEAVLTEVAYLVDNPSLGLRMLVRGDLVIDFLLERQKERVLELLEKYSGRMDLADACIVAMTEQEDRCQVWTVDETDFTIYRRHGRQRIPCAFPPKPY